MTTNSRKPFQQTARNAATVALAPPVPEPATAPTWCTLVAREPRLAVLLAQIEMVRDDPAAPSFCANALWFGYGSRDGFKRHMTRLVGVARRPDPLLGTSAAYDVAYTVLYGALPDCRGACACVRWEP